MNLQLNLLFRIILVAIICMLAITSYLLYQSHRLADQNTWNIAVSISQQLQSQLLLKNAGLGQFHAFPSFELWKQTQGQPGLCLTYTSTDKAMTRNLCHGIKLNQKQWPYLFEKAYRYLFRPGQPQSQPVALNDRIYGSLTVTPNAEQELTEAWNSTAHLLTLSSITVFAVCVLVYWNIRLALQPATTIVNGIENLRAGDLNHRLPVFKLNEWQRIAAAINQLASKQQQLLQERQQLIVKLIRLQEDERRSIARELHDEYGQCLAAINAVTASIKQTAVQQCPDVAKETNQISRITEQMLLNLNDLLSRLRPTEINEMDLANSLKKLIAEWNTRCNGKTRYNLYISGLCSELTEAQTVNLFRVTQECITNIAKHAQASHVDIALSVQPDSIRLIIKDDGITQNLPFTNVAGIGLLGIQERISRLQGQLKFEINQPHGLIVNICLPLASETENRS